MPALLGPTNPVPGYDTPPVKITTPPPSDTSVQNIVNPQQVVRPDGRTDQQDTGDAAQSFAARYESNFMTFIQRLRNMPELRTYFMQLLQGQETQVSSGVRSGLAQELSQFMEFLRMDEGQLLSFLQNQAKSGARFGGALFDTLRTAYAGSTSELVKGDILQFLRRFSDYSSTGHLEGKLVRTLYDMTRSLPSRWGDQLVTVLAKLQNGVAAGDREGNLQLLRDQVFPLISKYVSLTHDHGRARGLLSMLALDVARYENGSPEALLQTMRHLSADGVLPEELGKLPDKDLLRLLRETDFFKASRSDPLADKLASMADKALKGEAGVNVQEAFRSILSSILLNESVYMPLSHIMVPMQWNDRLMFSELWVDPDADRDSRQLSPGNGTLRILLKMDIQDVGAFDLLLNARQDNVSLHVACPPSVAAFDRQVSEALSGILERNGLKAAQVNVAEMKRPLTLSEVFPKIFEKGSGVNVKV